MFAAGLAHASTDKANTPVAVPNAPADTSTEITWNVSPLSLDTPEQTSATLHTMNKMVEKTKGNGLVAPSQCFTMRSYKFKEDSTAKDGLRPSGETTCEAASLFTLKDAVASK